MSRRKLLTVSELAKEAGLDPEEALILLWDTGLDRFEEVTDRVFRRELDQARDALGIAGPRQLTSPNYWKDVFRLSDKEFHRLLVDLRIDLTPAARRLPRGSVAKLRRRAKQQERLPESAIPPPPASSPEEIAQFRWHTVGDRKRAPTLTADEVEQIHWQLVKDFAGTEDPMEPPGLRSRDLLESAAFRPETSNGPTMKYPTAEMSVAALFQAIVNDHPFHNGNKRTALVSLLVQLDRSNLTVTCADNELFRLALRLAQHRMVPPGAALGDREVLTVADWICQNSRPVDKGLRPVTWRRLRKILMELGCDVTRIPGAGHRLSITRSVPGPRRLFQKPQARVLRTTLRNSGEGDDVSKRTIAKLREQLELDDDHGIDSITFYQGSTESVAEEFITKYRKALKNLAKV